MISSIVQSITNVDHCRTAYIAKTPDGRYLTYENRLSDFQCDALLLDSPDIFHQPFWENLLLEIIPVPISS